MSKSKTIMLIATFISLVYVSGFSGFYLGSLKENSSDNHTPIIRDMWVSRYPYIYPIMEDECVSYEYPYAYNVDVRDSDEDFMSIRFYVKHGDTWIMEQEQFGRNGIYTFYPYVYEYPISIGDYYSYVNAKVVITDNINTVSKMF